MFSLLDFGHSKVEVVALEYVKLVDIEFKRYDPQKIMENHLSQYNLKRYVHENSPQDEIFRGARSYEEVLDRVQNLSPNQQANFFNFQRHKWNSLPKVLQGDLVAPSYTQETIPPGFETGSSGGKETEENPKEVEVSIKKLEASISTPLCPQAKAQLEAFLKRGKDTSSSTLDKLITNTTEQQSSTKIGNPIISLTSFQSSHRNPSS
jgi:hypothetical protein